MASSTSSVEDFIDGCASRTPDKRRRQMLLSLCVCNAADAAEIVCIGYILGYLNTIPILEKEMLGASVIVGMLLGGIVTGQLGDRFGRRLCLRASILLSGAAGLCSAFAPTVPYLLLSRVIGGFGIGGVVPNIYALAAELFSKEKKDKSMMIIASSWVLGSVYASVAGWIVLGNDVQGRRICPSLTWRDYAIICSMPSFAGFLSAFALVESPHYLITRKLFHNAAFSLTYISDGNITVEDVQRALPQEVSPFQASRGVRPLPLVFYPPLLHPFAVLSLVWFATCFTGYGLLTWVQTIFFNLGYDNPYADACILALATIPGNILSIALLNATGRTKMLYRGLVLSALSTAGFSLSLHSATLVVFCATMYAFFNAFAWNALMLVTSDSYFPHKTRTAAIGLLTAFGRAGGISAQFVYGSLENNVAMLLSITTLVTVFGSMCVLLLPPERSSTDGASPKGTTAQPSAEETTENPLSKA